MICVVKTYLIDIKMTLKAFFNAKNTKNDKKCQLYDVIMTSRQYLMKF